MSVYGNSGISFLKLLYQLQHGFALLGGAGVLGLECVGVIAPYVAYAYGVLVMAFAVGARQAYGAALVYSTVQIDNVVVTYHVESPGLVPVVNIGYGIVAALKCGAAVDYYLFDCSHSFFSFKWFCQ